ncbi:MAG: hypothetical protein J6W64_06270 [Bacilli bacterium]|nr:hypothetical protein [Bacilli bacterium]
MDEQKELIEEEIEEIPEHEEIVNPIVQEQKQYFESLVKHYKGDYKQALFEYCFKNNIFFDGATYDLLVKGRDDAIFTRFPEIYVDTIAEDIRFKDQDFFSQLRMDNFEQVYSEQKDLLGLDEDTKTNRIAVLDIFAYDPFKNDSIEDRPQLYRDLAGMANESMRKDIAKQKAALNIVRSYQNIESYQRKITELMSSGQVDDESQKKLDSYMNIIAKIQDSINKTAEKNNFTVKGVGSSGKGTISDVMNTIEEKGVDEGITNFYDIATSQSIEEIANISFKAQLNQVNLSKTDYADILTNQCQMVREYQRIAKDSMEALRLAKEKIKKQELLDELEYDYRRKNISEEDIKELLEREYKLYDGK